MSNPLAAPANARRGLAANAEGVQVPVVRRTLASLRRPLPHTTFLRNRILVTAKAPAIEGRRSSLSVGPVTTRSRAAQALAPGGRGRVMTGVRVPFTPTLLTARRSSLGIGPGETTAAPSRESQATPRRAQRRAASLSIGPASVDATPLTPLIHRSATVIGSSSMAAPLVPSVRQQRERGGALDGSVSSEPGEKAQDPPPLQIPGDSGPLLGFPGAVLDPRPVSSAARARVSAVSSVSDLSSVMPLEGSRSRLSSRRTTTRSPAPRSTTAAPSSRASVASSGGGAASASALPPIPPQLPAMGTPAPELPARTAQRRSPQRRRAARSTVTVSTAFSESIVGPAGSGTSDYVAVTMPASGPSPGDRYRFHVEVEGNCCCAWLSATRVRVARAGGHSVPAGAADAAALQALWEGRGVARSLRAQVQAALEADVFDADEAADESVASPLSCLARINPFCAPLWAHPQCWGACRLCFFAHLPECRVCRTVTSCDLLVRYLKLREERRGHAAEADACRLCGICCAPACLGIVRPHERGSVRLPRSTTLSAPGFRVTVRGHRVGLAFVGPLEEELPLVPPAAGEEEEGGEGPVSAASTGRPKQP